VIVGRSRRFSIAVRRSLEHRSFDVRRPPTNAERPKVNDKEPPMCLGVPGLVVEVDELTALVDFWGVRRRVRLELVDEPVAPGDYILNHVGFAIRRIPSEDVTTTLALYEQLVRENTGSGPEDLMAADVRAEINAGQANAGLDSK
jgi:hydrogenase expression/formation protein HypC